MSKAVNRSQTARYTLLLVMAVIFVCSGQNFGFASACTLNSSSTHEDTQAKQTVTQHTVTDNSSTDSSEQGHCSLADHLLQMHQHSVDHAIVSLFVIVLALLIYAAFTKATPVFTEPIAPRRRRHLTLCVFRE